MKAIIILGRPIFMSMAFCISMSMGSGFAQDLPKFNSDQEKEVWIEKNSSEYERMINTESTSVPMPSGNVDQGEIENVKLTGFPVFVNTGNPEADAATYQKAKELWISENRDEYNSSFQQNLTVSSKGKTIIYADDFEKMPIERQTIVITNPDKYILSDQVAPASITPVSARPSIIRIPYEEFLRMPTERQAVVKENPSLYEIVD